MIRRPTKPSINSKFLEQAREPDINTSATIEAALQALIRRRQRENWLAENAEAVAAYNEHIEQRGGFSDRLRNF